MSAWMRVIVEHKETWQLGHGSFESALADPFILSTPCWDRSPSKPTSQNQSQTANFCVTKQGDENKKHTVE